MPFPKNFLWGASTSAAQVEGGWDADGRGPSNWDVKKLNPGTCSFHYASDFYHHYREDIALMGEMGFKAYRMSISWSRILPEGEGAVNQAGIDFYKGVFRTCREHGIEPVVTIFHFDLPKALQDRYGGWQDRRTVDAYVDYARILFENYKDDVKYWLTFNEQNALIFFGALDMIGGGISMRSMNELYNDGHRQVIAQARVIKLCHEMCPGAKIGPAPNITTSYPASCAPMDTVAAYNMDDLRNNWYIDPLVFGRYPKSVDRYFKMNGVELDTLPGDLELLQDDAVRPDFIGFNCYGNDTTEYLDYCDLDLNAVLAGGDNRDLSYLRALMDKPGVGRSVANDHFQTAKTDGHHYDPWCIRVTARRLTERYHLPVLITENGYGRSDVLEEDGAVHDQYRIEHLRETIRQMELGIEEGADIMGFCPWSAIDLVSTREGITKRYGFVYVDRDEDDEKAKTAPMKRYKKDSFYWYQRVIATNGEDLGE